MSQRSANDGATHSYPACQMVCCDTFHSTEEIVILCVHRKMRGPHLAPELLRGGYLTAPTYCLWSTGGGTSPVPPL